MQKWYDDNDNLMYLTHNESKSVVVERFMRTLKGKSIKNEILKSWKWKNEILSWLF